MAHPDDWETLERDALDGLRRLAFWHGFAAGLVCVVGLCVPVSWFAPEGSAWVVGAVVLACSGGTLVSVVGFTRADRHLRRNHERRRQALNADARALIERLEARN
jgi:hypothetical protein